MKAEEIHEKLKVKFGDKILKFAIDTPQPIVEVAPDTVREILVFLKDEDDLRFEVLMCLSGIDYGEELGVTYDLHSMKYDHKIMIKVKLPANNAKIASVSDLWKTANWHEREAYDLIGIVFEGHTDLRRILLPDDWEGHPLRKDYEVPEFYRGMKVPY